VKWLGNSEAMCKTRALQLEAFLKKKKPVYKRTWALNQRESCKASEMRRSLFELTYEDPCALGEE